MTEDKIKTDWAVNEFTAMTKARGEAWDALKHFRDVCKKYNICFQVEQYDRMDRPEISFETPAYTINLGGYFDADILTEKIKGVVNE